MLRGTLQRNGKLSEWAKWVRDDLDPAAVETREFLGRCFANIREAKRARLLARLRSGDTDNVDASLHELVAHELFRRLHFEPKFEPKVGGLTPDMTAKVADHECIVDVFLTRNPSRTTRRTLPGTLLDLPEGTQYTVDAGDRAKKVRDTILEKHHKYSATGRPMILVVFLGDHWVQMRDVQCALYGVPLADAWLRDDFPNGIANFRKEVVAMHREPPAAGAMLPDDRGQPGCPNLSAVIACDWFDTLNSSRPGKRLSCLVLHHWKPRLPIPAGHFDQFPEVAWCRERSGSYMYTIKNSLCSVAKFTGADEFEFAAHSWDKPW